MKDNKVKLGLFVAALLTMAQSAQSTSSRTEDAQEEFAPIETLTPEYRAMLRPQIELLRKTIKIDWNTVAIGINKKGELTLKGREAAGNENAANPTCWAD